MSSWSEQKVFWPHLEHSVVCNVSAPRERDLAHAVAVTSHVCPCSGSHCNAEASVKGLSLSPAQLWLCPPPAHARLVLLEITVRVAIAHGPSPAAARHQPSRRSPLQQPATQPRCPGRGGLGPFPSTRISVQRSPGELRTYSLPPESCGLLPAC